MKFKSEVKQNLILPSLRMVSGQQQRHESDDDNAVTMI